MLANYRNPIFLRLIASESPSLKWRWQLLTLAVMTVVGGIWLALIDYPRVVMNAIPWFALFGALMLAMLLTTLISTLIQRSTREEAYPLLFLTNIGRERVVWGHALGIAWRLRIWITFYVWLFWLGGFFLSLNTYDVLNDNLSAVGILPSAYVLPPRIMTLSYGTMWLLCAISSISGVVGSGVLNGFRRASYFNAIVRGGIVLLIAHGGSIGLLVFTLAFGQTITIELFIVLAYLLLVANIGSQLARRWQYDARLVLHTLTDVVPGTVFGWPIVAFLAYTFSSAGPYWQFVFLFWVLLFTVAGQLRVHNRRPLAVWLTLTGILIGISLLYMGGLRRQSLASVLSVVGVVAAVVAIWLLLHLILVRPQQDNPSTLSDRFQIRFRLWLRLLLLSGFISVGAYILGYSIPDSQAELSPHIWVVLFLGLMIGWSITAIATWGNFRGVAAISTVLVQVGFVGSIAIDAMTAVQNDSPITASLTLFWVALALCGALLGAGLSSIRNTWHYVWPRDYVIG